MVAFEIPGMRFSVPAGADVQRHRLVSVNADGNGVVATASTAIVGASMNQAKNGEVLEVADGLVMVEAGGTIAAGATVASDASGKAVAGEGVGIAITSAAAGELVTVKL